MTSGSSTQTGNGVYLHAASSLQALSKACGNSSSATFEEYLFPKQKVSLSGRSAPGLGRCGTGWCECPQREGVFKQESYRVRGGGGEEEHCPPRSCSSGANVEKGEVSHPSMGRTPVSELVVNHRSPSQQPCHHGSAPPPAPCPQSTAWATGSTTEGEWGCLHPESCLSLCGDH